MAHKIFSFSFADIYSAYLAKIQRKGREESELEQILCWFLHCSHSDLQKLRTSKQTMEDVLGSAEIPEPARHITGSICGVKIQEIEDPLMKNIRIMDKLVDECAKGKALDKIIRS